MQAPWAVHLPRMASSIIRLPHSADAAGRGRIPLRGIKVEHIIDETRAVMHPYTSPARLFEGRLSYVPTEGKPLAQSRELASKRRPNSPAKPEE